MSNYCLSKQQTFLAYCLQIHNVTHTWQMCHDCFMHHQLHAHKTPSMHIEAHTGTSTITQCTHATQSERPKVTVQRPHAQSTTSCTCPALVGRNHNVANHTGAVGWCEAEAVRCARQQFGVGYLAARLGGPKHDKPPPQCRWCRWMQALRDHSSTSSCSQARAAAWIWKPPSPRACGSTCTRAAAVPPAGRQCPSCQCRHQTQA